MAETDHTRGEATARAAGAGSTAADASTQRHAGAADGGAVCSVAFCPICAAVSTLNRASPEVLEHLLIAGQQFLMAFKAVLDARAADLAHDDGAGGEGGGRAAPSMQRIDIA